jgi:itaconate CoA-transferase
MLGLQNEREWKAFCDKVLLRPELATDPRFDLNPKRSEHRVELKRIILEVFGQLGAEQVIARLEEAQIANAHVNTVGELWNHPQLKARDRFRTIGSPAGELVALLPPGVNSSFDYRMDAVPAVGQHGEAILRELGRSEDQIASMRTAGAI